MRGEKLNKNSTLLPPAEPLENSIPEDSGKPECMQEWLDAAMCSEDYRDRIAVTTGVSRGSFGMLAFSVENVSTDASNDEDYGENEVRRIAR